MGKLCEYKMCHNLGSSAWAGYCNENHYKRGLKEEEKERQTNQTTSSSRCEEYTSLPRGSNSEPRDESRQVSHTSNNPGSKS
jgi:hypothetical protein